MYITVLFLDNIVTVDGETYSVTMPDIPEHAGVYSIVWYGTYGEVDRNDGTRPITVTKDTYTEYITPYVKSWEEGKRAYQKAVAEREAAEYALYHSPEALQRRFRKERNKRLSATDYYFEPDYPAVSEAKMKAVKEYRTALRDMTDLEGFPWDGGGEETPWPVLK